MSLKIKTITVIGFLMVISLITLAIQQKVFYADPIEVKNEPELEAEPESVPVYDAAVLKKFEQICNGFSTASHCYSGTITEVNHADSSAVIENIEFALNQKGSDFYYKLGNTETINANGLYLYIDHDHQKVAIAPQKETSQPLLMNMTGLLQNIKSENYTVSVENLGKQQKISLVNEYHVSCKEYAITFDTLSKNITRIYTRLSNLEEPERTDNEKEVDMRISNWENFETQKNTLKNNIVRKDGDTWILTELYSTYDLIFL